MKTAENKVKDIIDFVDAMEEASYSQMICGHEDDPVYRAVWKTLDAVRDQIISIARQ